MTAGFNFPYNAVQITEQVNRIPNNYGLLNALDAFPSESVSSRIVQIRYEDSVISVLPAQPTGSPGTTTEREDGKSIFLEIPHFPHLETILPADLQGVLDIVGNILQPKTLDREVAKRLLTIRTNHAITREYVRLGALKGVIKDGKGRVIHDLYDVFDIEKKTIDFALATPGTDVIAKCDELLQYFAENMRGETMTGIEVITDGMFFNKLVQHPKVEKYWLNTQNATALANMERQRLGGQWGRVFEFQTIMFREYRGSLPVRTAQGALTSEKIIADNKGHARPLGTQNAFRTYDGPVDHINYVNQPGQDIFVSPEPLKHGAGVEMKSQSNVLAVTRRPDLIVEVTTN